MPVASIEILGGQAPLTGTDCIAPSATRLGALRIGIDTAQLPQASVRCV